jgi:asparagine synthase (glutamine-hydrolysing)
LVPSKIYDEMKMSILNWPLEYCAIERAPDGSFQICSGQWGTAPVYVAEAAGRLHGSWSFVDLTPYASLDELNDVEVVRLLTYRKRYSRETLLGRIFQITERSRATYDATGLRFTYPAPATQVHPREIRDGIDVLDAYEQELEHAISQRYYNPGESAVELSGGMDSANIAMSLAALHHGKLLACALMFGGESGVQQARRRTEMLKLTGFRDLRVDALSWAPFHPAGERMNGALLDPFTEPYHEAVGMIIAEMRRNGTTTVFTGDGGDELVSLRGREWAALGKVPGRHNTHREPPRWLTSRARELLQGVDRDLAPASVLNEASLLGFACRTPQFVAAGLWPVSPLCSPRLIRFAQQLPVKWRNDKRICRERLTRLGLSDDVVRPRLRENFTHVMEHGLRRHGIPLLARLLPNSVLVELGYVDPGQLQAAHDRVVSTGHVETSLYAFLHLELTVRGLCR